MVLFCPQPFFLLLFLSSPLALFFTFVFFKFVLFGNFTILEIGCPNCSYSSLFIPFVSSFLNLLFLFFVLLCPPVWSFPYPVTPLLLMLLFVPQCLCQMKFYVVSASSFLCRLFIFLFFCLCFLFVLLYFPYVSLIV